MKTLRVFFSPGIWVSVILAVGVLGILYFAYLYPVINAQDNLEDLPVAIVNHDAGAELSGEVVSFGDQVESRLTEEDSPASNVVAWETPESREEALEEISNNRLYGAVIIPRDYSERIARIATPPRIPLAIVNEDSGGNVGGREVNLGAQVEARIMAPGSPAPQTVTWSSMDGREAALEGIENGEFYAAIVIPEDYSSNVGGVVGDPEANPATLQLLTSPAVTPSVTRNIESAFEGIVGGISTATSDQLLDALSGQDSGVPQGAGGILSDPVAGAVSKADVSGAVGSLPKTPEPARIEVLTNPSAGQSVAAPVERIATGAVAAISRATSERLSSQASENGAQLGPELAAVLGDPVRAEVTEAQPIGENGASGQAPFFLSFLGNLSAIMGGAVIFFGVKKAANGLSRTGQWTLRLLVGFAFSLAAAAAELWVSFGVMGIEHEAPLLQTFVFLALAVWAILTLVLVLEDVFGVAGIALAAILGVILGLVSSGSLVPVQSLTGFYSVYADWLPVRYLLDGMRSLLFFGGRDAAGLGNAITIFIVYLIGASATGYAVSIVRDVSGKRKAAKTQSPSA